MALQLHTLSLPQVTLHFESLPSFKDGDEETLEMQLWTKLGEAGVLVAPGWYFAPNPDALAEKAEGHLRISFSNAEVRSSSGLLSKFVFMILFVVSLVPSSRLFILWAKFSGSSTNNDT